MLMSDLKKFGPEYITSMSFCKRVDIAKIKYDIVKKIPATYF